MPTVPAYAVEFVGVAKRFGDVSVLEGLDLRGLGDAHADLADLGDGWALRHLAVFLEDFLVGLLAEVELLRGAQGQRLAP